jgi:large subunit ribosomal protein L6
MKQEKQKIKTLNEEIEIPSGISAEIIGNEIIMRKNNGEIKRKLNNLIETEIKENKIFLKSRKSTRKEKRIFGSMKAHIKNMIIGLTEGFKYKLQAASIHFPITLKIDNEKNELLVKNFLGEKKDRVIKIFPGVDVKINKDIIELESPDIEKAGLTASNIEKGTKVRFRDRRIFQDGIFITEKPGRKLT